jgi:ribosomal protein S18 acetylase RimI-like enzyme
MGQKLVGSMKAIARRILATIERIPSGRRLLQFIGFELLVEHHDGRLDIRTLYEWVVPISEPLATDIQLRQFEREKDEADIVRIFSTAFAWHPDVGARPGSVGGRLDDDTIDPTNILVHEVDGQIVALCILANTELAGRPVGFVDVLAIDPDEAARGLGTGLERAISNLFLERGFKWMTLVTESTNYAMNRIQLRAGGSIYRLTRLEGPPLDVPLPGGSSPNSGS